MSRRKDGIWSVTVVGGGSAGDLTLDLHNLSIAPAIPDPQVVSAMGRFEFCDPSGERQAAYRPLVGPGQSVRVKARTLA